MAQRLLLLSVPANGRSVPMGKWRNRAELGALQPGMMQRLSSLQRLHGKAERRKWFWFACLKTELFRVVVQDWRVSRVRSSARIDARELLADAGGVHRQPEETQATSVFGACPALTVPRAEMTASCAWRGPTLLLLLFSPALWAVEISCRNEDGEAVDW